MFYPKQEVLKLFLTFVASYVALPRAKLATLGGEGLEAMLWQTLGIEPKNGWLIECVRRKSRHLMVNYPYRHCSRLAYFRQIAESIWGSKYGIDGFHLDLCGTYERADAAFRPVIPIIMRSAGKCLAVTVADQRRNSSQEHAEDVRRHAEQLYGDSSLTACLYSKVLHDYRTLPDVGIGLTADPESGTEREFGFAFHLLKALDRLATAHIDRIERFLYVSNGKGCPFRMRTYFFHFGGRRSKQFVQDAVQLWLHSPLQCVTEQGLIPIHASRLQEVAMKSSYASLQKLAEGAGGVHLDEFNQLVADAEYGRSVHAIQYGLSSFAPAEPPKPTLPAAVAGKSAKNGASLRAQLDMLRAGAKGSKELAAAKGRAIKSLGLKGKAKNRAVGAHHARTQGSFRPKFMKALAKHGMLDEHLLQELAGIYTAINGKEVTAEELKQESSN